MLDAKAAQFSGGSEDPYWKQALADFEKSHRPKPPKEGFRGSFTREQRQERLQFFEEFLKDQSTPQEARKVCQDIQNSANDQYTNQSVNFILGNLDYVIKAGDIAFKGGAESFAMAWSGVKFILLAVQADKANCGRWAAAGAAISTILVACRTLGKLYTMPAGSASTDAASEVVGKLPGIYGAILNFSYAAKIQLDHNKARRMFDQFNPFSSQGDASDSAMEGIKSAAKDIRDASNVAFQEWSKQASEASLEGQEDIKKEVQSFRSLYIEHEKEQDEMLKSINAMLEETKGIALESKNMIEQLLKDSTVKTPFEIDQQRFRVKKKELEPLDDYLKSTYAAKIKIHDERPETCKWIFADQTYVDWLGSEGNSLLWISGGAGYGKSILVSHVIETLKSTEMVIYFYCSKIGSSDATSRAGQVKRDLVAQLYQATYNDPDHLAEANRIFAKPPKKKVQSKGDSPKESKDAKDAKDAQPEGLPDMEEAFVHLAALIKKRVFLVIDALDECIDCIPEFLIETLQQWVTTDNISLKILVSSRREADLEMALSNEANIRVEEHNSDDICMHTDSALSQVSGFASKERTQLSNAIVERAKGQFTYVNLAMQLIRKPFVRPIENLISKLAENNRSMNQETLKAVDPTYRELAKTSLTWTLLRQGNIGAKEILDVYSRTYDLDDVSPAQTGTDISETTKEEAKVEDVAGDDEKEDDLDYYVQQVRSAAGPFLEIRASPSYFLAENHPSVRESFLQDTTGHVARNTHEPDCSECKRPFAEDGEFLIDPKYDHLRLAIICLTKNLVRHINNATFQASSTKHGGFLTKEELIHINDDESSESESDSDTGSVLSSDSEAKYDTDEKSDVDGDNPESEEEDSEADDGDSEEGASENENDGDDEDDEGEADEEEPEDDGDEKSKAQIEAEKGEVTPEIQTTEPKAEEDDAAEPENGTDSDSADESEIEDYDDDSDYSSYDGSDDGDWSPGNPKYEAWVRYEVRAWPYHVKEAEKLWGWPDRLIDPFAIDSAELEWNSQNPEVRKIWGELQEQLFKLFENEVIFRRWALSVGGKAGPDFWDQIKVLTPMHIAAAYGLYSVAVMLREKGHQLTARENAKYSTAPLWFLRWSSSINKDVNLMRFLAGRSEVEPDHHKGVVHWASERKGAYGSAFCNFFDSDPEPDFVAALVDVGGDTAGEGSSEDVDKALLQTAEEGTHPEVVKTLVEMGGANINAKDDSGSTALHLLLGRLDLPEDMLEAFLSIPNIDVNAEDGESERPIVGASRRGHLRAAKLLIGANADLNDTDAIGDTATMVAAGWGSTEVLELLVQHGGSLTTVNMTGRTPLYYACSSAYDVTALKILELLKDESIDIVDKITTDGRTPLRTACLNDLTTVVEAMLKRPDYKSRIELKDEKWKRTPLHCAALKGSTEIVKLLLDAGADTKATDIEGRSSVDLAINNWLGVADGDAESTILALIEKDPSLALRKDGNPEAPSLMHIAAAQGSTKFLEKLLDLKISPNQKDHHGWTPLLLARQAKHDEAVALLERRGGESGNRPSRLAVVQNKHFEISEDGQQLNWFGKYHGGLVSNHPVPAELEGQYYYEVTVTSTEDTTGKSPLAVGFCADTRKSFHPRWTFGNTSSYAGLETWTLNGKSGSVIYMVKYGDDERCARKPKLTFVPVGQTIGCGIDLAEGTMFYTIDGKHQGSVFEHVNRRLFPFLGLSSKATVAVNFGAKEFVWKPGNDLRK